jgi:hypothetical protein
MLKKCPETTLGNDERAAAAEIAFLMDATNYEIYD